MNLQKVFVKDVLELSFNSECEYSNPYIEGNVSVTFHLPEAEVVKVNGFWDGDHSWKVRFAPPAKGLWKWQSESENIDDTGLNGKNGEFEVVQYEGNNPILKHGFLKVTDNGRGFAHEDGKPFFWLGDTAWSVSTKAALEDWQEYIQFRTNQGFNVININALPQFDSSKAKVSIEPFLKEGNKMLWEHPNCDYFQHLDSLMNISHQAGMHIAMVALWFNYVPGTNPSWPTARTEGLTPELACAYGSYLAARYAAYKTIWVISGDSDFESKEAISIYDSAANAIKNSTPYAPLITAHLHGALPTPEKLNEKDWLTFHMFQSSHTIEGVQVSIDCATKDRAYAPTRPVLNGEPCYEDIGYYRTKNRFSRETVRETLWKSILGGANAGITYGAHGIWSWHCEGDKFFAEDEWQLPVNWREALLFKGADDASKMKKFFEEMSWWELEPFNQELEACNHPNCMAAATPDKRILVVYVPQGEKLKINIPTSHRYICSWFNPISGECIEVEPKISNGIFSFDAAPWSHDAIIKLSI